MALVPVVQKALTAADERLQDPTTGFNANVALSMRDEGLTKYAIDFSRTGRNYYVSDISAQDFIVAAPWRTLPALTIGIASGEDLKEIKGRDFSGMISIVVRVFLSWSGQMPPFDASKTVAATLDALIQTFASMEVASSWLLGEARYANGMTFEISPMARFSDGGDWMQVVVVVVPLRVDS